MKTMKLMIGVICCLVTTSWGADSLQLIEGAVGEAESSVSFFKNEIKSTIVKAEEALGSFKDNFNNPNQSIHVKYQETKALETLARASRELTELHRILEDSKANADRIRALLNTAPNENNE